MQVSGAHSCQHRWPEGAHKLPTSCFNKHLLPHLWQNLQIVHDHINHLRYHKDVPSGSRILTSATALCVLQWWRRLMWDLLALPLIEHVVPYIIFLLEVVPKLSSSLWAVEGYMQHCVKNVWDKYEGKEVMFPHVVLHPGLALLWSFLLSFWMCLFPIVW